MPRMVVAARVRQYFAELRAELDADTKELFQRVMQQAELAIALIVAAAKVIELSLFLGLVLRCCPSCCHHRTRRPRFRVGAAAGAAGVSFLDK